MEMNPSCRGRRSCRHMSRNNSCTVFGAYHEAKERAEAHRRCRADEVQSRYRCLEGGVQPWRARKALDRTAQLRMNKLKAFDIDVITATGNNMVNHQPTLTSVLREAQLKRHTAGCLARLDDCRSEMDGQPVLHSIAKPPCAFGWQVILNEASSPCRGHSVHRTRKMSEPPGFWPSTQPRNRRAQSPPETTLERDAILPQDRILAYQKVRLCARLAQQSSRFKRRLARPDHGDLAPFERGEASNPGGMGGKS